MLSAPNRLGVLESTFPRIFTCSVLGWIPLMTCACVTQKAEMKQKPYSRFSGDSEQAHCFLQVCRLRAAFTSFP